MYCIIQEPWHDQELHLVRAQEQSSLITSSVTGLREDWLTVHQILQPLVPASTREMLELFVNQ